MDDDSVAEQIVNSLSFEVVAVPQDNILQLTATTKSAPLNVKIRVRKKDVAEIRNGVISLPKNRPDSVPERVRLVSSDQTIMSFNVVMEADFQKPAKKPRRIWGIFKPHRGGKCRTSAARRKKDFFGRCKPGGCLDPPFGEDRVPYSPAIVNEEFTCTSTNVSKGQRRASSIFSNKLFHNKKKKNDSETLDNNVIQNETKAKSVVNLYQAELENPYSTNSIMTYPPTLNSSETQEEKRGSRIYTDPSKNSFNEHTGSYFMIPKKPKNVLDKNSIVKDENDGNVRDSKFSEALNINSGENNINFQREILSDDALKTKSSATENTESSNSYNLKEQKPVESAFSDNLNHIVPIPIPLTEQNERRKQSRDKDLESRERKPESNSILKKRKSSSDNNKQTPVERSISDNPNYILPIPVPTLPAEQDEPQDKDLVTRERNSKLNNLLQKRKSSSDAKEQNSVKRSISDNPNDILPIPVPTPPAKQDERRKESQDKDLVTRERNSKSIDVLKKSDSDANNLKDQNPVKSALSDNSDYIVPIPIPPTEQGERRKESQNLKDSVTRQRNSNSNTILMEDKSSDANNLKNQSPVESSISDNPNYNVPTPIITQTEQGERGKRRKESQDKDSLTRKRNSKLNNVLNMHKSSSVDNLDDVIQSDEIFLNKDITGDLSSPIEQIVSENKPGNKSAISIGSNHELSILDITNSTLQDERKSPVKDIENQRFTDMPIIKNEPLETKKDENKNLQHSWENKNDPMASDVKLKKDNEVYGKELYEQTSNKSFSILDGKIRLSREKSQSENDIANNLDLPKELRVIPESINQIDYQINTLSDKKDSTEVSLQDISTILQPAIVAEGNIGLVQQSSLEMTTEQSSTGFFPSDLPLESGKKTIANTQLTEPLTFEDDENNNNLGKNDADAVVFNEDNDIKVSETDSKTEIERDLSKNDVENITESKRYDNESNASYQLELGNTEDKTALNNNSKESSEYDSFGHNMDDSINDYLNINDSFNSQTEDVKYGVQVQDTEYYSRESQSETRKDGEASYDTIQDPFIIRKLEPTKPEEAINKDELPFLTDKTQDLLKDSELNERNDNIRSPSLLDALEQEEIKNQNKTSTKHITFDNEIKIASEITSPENGRSKKGLSDQNILSKPFEITPTNNKIPIVVTFAVQSYVDDMNQMIVKSLDADNLTKPQDSVKVTERYLNIDEEIKLPLDLENDLCLQIKSNKPRDNINEDKTLTYNVDKGITITPIEDNKRHLDESDMIKRNVITSEVLRKTLEAVYEKELLPLRSSILELKNNIELLTKQHMILNGHMFVRKSRSTKITPIFKKCSCTRIIYR